MAVKLTITPETTSVGVTNNVTELTISTAIAGAATDAQGITFQNAARTISDASTVEQALLQLADQFFVQTTAPTAGTTNLAEGDFFYDTDDNQLKVYRETSPGTLEFVPLAEATGTMDILDAGSF